jgi:hypothetical protein
MMIRWYAITLTLATYCYVSGMDRYHIKVDAENGKTNLSLVETNPPKISLDGCAFCDQNGAKENCNFCKYESTIFCGQCQGVYYCSPECKYAHSSSHQKDCQKIKQAHYGDFDSIEGFITANVAQFNKTKEEKYLNELVKWYRRKSVRLLVDSACCTDPKFKDIKYLDSLVGPREHLNLIMIGLKEIPDDVFGKFTAAFDWIRTLINNNELVSPHDILRYSDYYLKESVGGEELPLVPESQWKKNRLQALKQQEEAMKVYREELREKNK